VDFEKFMEALRQGWIKHTGDGEFRRHVMNAVVRVLPADKRRFDRPVMSRGSGKDQDPRVIDALDAASMVNTVAEAMFHPKVPFMRPWCTPVASTPPGARLNSRRTSAFRPGPSRRHRLPLRRDYRQPARARAERSQPRDTATPAFEWSGERSISPRPRSFR
jgi:hypothetical protein